MRYKSRSFFVLLVAFFSLLVLPCMASAGWTPPQTLDSTGSVGQYTSIATDSSNKVHISYFDAGTLHLKYISNAPSGAWQTPITVDNTAGVGQYTSIAIDSSDRVHISYFDATNQRLKYATNATPSGSWQITPVDSNFGVGLYTSIAIDSSDKVHISYYDGTFFALKYATNATPTGAWQITSIDTIGSLGFNPFSPIDIAIDSGDKVHISYYDATNRDLRYATTATPAGAWQITSFVSTADIGLYSSIAVDQSDRVHISFFDGTNFDLKYITNATASGSWQSTTVDSTGYVGEYNSIAVDSDYTVHISYYNATNLDLKYAKKTGTPDISSDPSSLNFGNVNAGSSSSPRTFTITNNGTATLNIGTIILGGTHASEFSITEDNCSTQTILPFSDCTVKVVFSPILPIGTKSANLSIPSNDPDRATLNVPLRGNGVVQYTLIVNKTGTGDGTVKSSPVGIDCGATCSAPFTSGTRVTLTATVPVESLFSGWTGCDSTSGTRCYVTMNSDKTVTADFFLQTFLITLLSPADTTPFDTCSLYSLPTFQWNTSGTYRSLEIQFSDDGFVTIPVRVRLRPDASAYLMTFSLWRRVLLIPGTGGGTASWKVVGTRIDNSKIESSVSSFVAKAPEAVGSPFPLLWISHTNRTTLPPPTLSWQNNCNKRFRVWFGNNSDFTAVGIRKMVLSFSVTDPTSGGGIFSKELTSSQWLSIRRLVGDVTGATIYWYVESWDGANRYSKTAPPMSFTLDP